MVPYYLSHFGFKDIFKSIFQNHSKKLIKEFYKEYSNKKHILLTPSCRIALYLSNIVINKTGLVLTSPLTCQSAIEPIIWAGKKPYFCDIDLNTLNIDPQKAIQILKSTTKISTLQVINHGGLSAYNKDLYQIAKEKGVSNMCFLFEYSL